MNQADLKRLFPHASSWTIAANSSAESITRLQPETARPTQLMSKSEVASEKQLQRTIADYLRSQDIWFFNSRMDRRTTNPVGTPDFLCVVRGIPVAFEAKVSGRKATPEQEKTHKLMRENGWDVYLVYSLKEAIETVMRLEGTKRS